ncbi:MAG: hypothetical protein JOZ54_24815 [Acidobacteria bacterium]|nr:hypothetical protein [Acidobacteriota bacterium]
MRTALAIFLTLLAAFLGLVSALAVSGVGICARDLDGESIGIAIVCALLAGFCSMRISWGATIAFGLPFTALCVFFRAEHFLLLIAIFVGFVAVMTMVLRAPGAEPTLSS